MEKFLWFFLILTAAGGMASAAGAGYEQDVIPTSAGDLKATFFGHASLMFEFNKLAVYVDPVGNTADYSKLPKADLILLTHEHGDHLDPKTIDLLKGSATEIILTAKAADKLKSGTVMANGQVLTRKGIKIEAVPAYNIVNMRSPGMPFHPKGEGNGYVLTFGDKRVYVAGDTENIPEMKNLKAIDVAFLPMNLPYTMTPEMTADAARTVKPKILYPYHYGETDTSKLVNLLKDARDIEVRIRRLN